MNLTALRVDALSNVSFQLTTTDYPTASIDLALNKWYRLAMAWAILASGIWEVQADKSTADLVLNQNEYVLPTNIVMLNRVCIKYPNATNYVYARRIDDQETTEAFENGVISTASEGSPVFREFDNSIWIYPAPTAAVTAGLAIELIDDITDLAAGGDIPNLNPLVHQIMSLGAARDFCDSEEMYNKVARLELRIFGKPASRYSTQADEGLKQTLEDLAANRDRTARAQIRPRVRRYN